VVDAPDPTRKLPGSLEAADAAEILSYMLNIGITQYLVGSSDILVRDSCHFLVPLGLVIAWTLL
jgi:hypothetical protein